MLTLGKSDFKCLKKYQMKVLFQNIQNQTLQSCIMSETFQLLHCGDLTVSLPCLS